MRMTPPPEHQEDVGEGWAEFIQAMAPEFAKPTIEQIETVTQPIWEALVEGEQYSHERVMAIWDEVRPDVVVTDNVTGYPAVELAGAPWVRVVSATRSRCATRTSRPPSPAARRPIARLGGVPRGVPSAARRLLAEHNEFRASVGVEPLPAGRVQHDSPWLDLYLFPGAADYPGRGRSTPRGTGSTPRCAPASRPFDVDEHLPGDGKVVYLSLGSLGCMDVGLMQRLIDALAKTEHRVIVSMGPLKDQMRLGDACTAIGSCRSPRSCRSATSSITHGGNNTVCEGFHFGLPMIGLPLFWDQYDNAQRLRRRASALVCPPTTGPTRSWSPRSTGCSPTTGCAGCARSPPSAGRPGRVKGADLIERVLRSARRIRSRASSPPVRDTWRS